MHASRTREITRYPYHLPALAGAGYTFIEPPWAVALSGGRSACPSVTHGRGRLHFRRPSQISRLLAMLAVVRHGRKVRISVSGERVTPVKVAVFFQAAQLEARCCRVECGRYGGSISDAALLDAMTMPLFWRCINSAQRLLSASRLLPGRYSDRGMARRIVVDLVTAGYVGLLRYSNSLASHQVDQCLKVNQFDRRCSGPPRLKFCALGEGRGGKNQAISGSAPSIWCFPGIPVAGGN